MGVIKINNIIYGSNNSADIIYKNTTVEEKLNSIPVFDPSDNANIEASYDFLTYAHIVNDLKSEANNRVLSAKQGKILNEKIDNINLSYLEDGIATNTENINTLNSDLASLSGKVNTNFTTLNNSNSINSSNITTNSNNITTLNNKVPFSFGIDANGNYGYIKDGADTVAPFNQYNFTLSNSEITKGDAAKTYTYTVSEKGKYLVKMFNTSCEGYNSTFTLTTTNGTNTIFANDDVISATTSKSRTRILLAICDMKANGVISCAKTNAAGYGIHGMYVYKIN